ncbi:MAG: hypothetical protein K6G88_04670 [Lachnospiraceae bacterium]|nr:hypothetical protein [Lachnospiraceae bacterium]
MEKTSDGMPEVTFSLENPYIPFGKNFIWDAGGILFLRKFRHPIWKKLHMGCRGNLISQKVPTSHLEKTSDGMPGESYFSESSDIPFGKNFTWDAGGNFLPRKSLHPIWKKLHRGCQP